MQFLTFTTDADYAKLQPLPFNRVLPFRQDLASSMRKNGFTDPICLIETDIISGKKEMFVADGGNRVVVATQLKIPIYAVLIEKVFRTLGEIVEFVAEQNCTQWRWRINDYVKCYTHLNCEEYKKLVRVASTSPFTLSTIASLLYGVRSRGVVHKYIKKGEFKCLMYNQTLETLAYGHKISVDSRPLNGRMIQALHYVRAQSVWDETKFTHKYEMYYSEIRGLNLDSYTDIFMKWLIEN